MISIPKHYSDQSAEELRAFLSGTHPRLGRGSLPYRLGQRGPELLRLVSEFVLTPRVLLFVGLESGGVEVFEDHSSKPAHAIAAPPPGTCPLSAWSPIACPQRVCGLATNGSSWLVVATSCGCLRSLHLPSYEEHASIVLGTPLPSQTAVHVAADVAFVASKRELFVVDLAQASLLHQLALPFSARPLIAVEARRAFVKCDNAVRSWTFTAPSGASADDCRPGAPDLCDLLGPHRQVVTGMAVAPGGQAVATASPEEVRCWSWPRSGGRAPQLLWRLALGQLAPRGSPSGSVSLALQGGRGGSAELLVVAAGHGGAAQIHEAVLDRTMQSRPRALAKSELSRRSPSPDDGDDDDDARVVAESRAPLLVTWSKRGWKAWDLQCHSVSGHHLPPRDRQQGITALAVGVLAKPLAKSRRGQSG